MPELAQFMTRCSLIVVKVNALSLPLSVIAPAVQARRDVEGSLFLQKRRSAPTYQFTILNKKSQCERRSS